MLDSLYRLLRRVEGGGSIYGLKIRLEYVRGGQGKID
jgi:hypothetical protein